MLAGADHAASLDEWKVRSRGALDHPGCTLIYPRGTLSGFRGSGSGEPESARFSWRWRVTQRTRAVASRERSLDSRITGGTSGGREGVSRIHELTTFARSEL